METKICSKCHLEKPIKDFNKSKYTKSGLRSQCKDCENNILVTVIRETKTCSQCKIEKPINQFHKSKQSLDGHRPECKECFGQKSKKYYKNNKKDILSRNKQHSIKHQKERKKYIQSYYQKNKKQINQKCAEYLI